MAAILNEATRRFIAEHGSDDVRQLALRGCKDPEVDLAYALDQIAGRQTAREKLPSWAALDGIIYPPHLSMEQCSSERTARYKADIAGKGRLMVDLTGGFGVDFAWMAQGFERAVYVECQPQLCAISSENFRTLGLSHAEVVCADGTDYLESIADADLIFVDPARRDIHGSRTYGIADCTPNVLELMPRLTGKMSRLLLKLSPMLDWRKAVSDIGNVSQVHIVSVDNECKELLLVVTTGGGRDCKSPPTGGRGLQIPSSGCRVVCVNLLTDGRQQRFEFDATESVPSPLTERPCERFLFEPNASVMKAGCFGLLAGRYSVSYLDANSHLYVSDHDVADFPGRRFAIERKSTMNKREMKAALSGIERANIAVRNFPMTVADLRKRLRLKDGGDCYIFATTVAEAGHQLFICRKIG